MLIERGTQITEVAKKLWKQMGRVEIKPPSLSDHSLKWLHRSERLTDPQRLALVIGLFAGIVLLDGVTDWPKVISHLYYFPIWAAAWYLNRRAAWSMALGSCAATMLLTDGLMATLAEPNGLVILTRLLMYGFSVLLVAALRDSFDQQHRLARIDTLTGCLNTRGFHEEARSMMAQIREDFRPFTLIFLDIDHFKDLNDKVGHSEADKALQTIGHVLRNMTRRSDIVARLGGDEFVVMLRQTNAETSFAAVERIKRKVEAELRKRGFGVTISMGCVAFTDLPKNVRHAIEIGDAFMYEAKRDGRSRIATAIWGGRPIRIDSRAIVQFEDSGANRSTEFPSGSSTIA